MLTVRQGGTGNIQIWKDGNNEVGTFADGGLFGLGTTTPKSRLSVSTLAQAAPTTKLFTVASTTGASLFQVNANGLVGLGDATPDTALDILSSRAVNTQITITNTNASDYDTQIGFQVTEGTNVFTMGVDDSDSDKFKISTTGLGTNDRLVIDSSGLVGIGTSTPTARLAVSAAAQSSTPLFRVASTTGALLFQVAAKGDLKMANNKWFKTIGASTTIANNEINIFKASASDEVIGGAKMKFDITKGLIGQWSMAQTDLKSSTIMADKSGFQHDGTISNGVGFVTDQKGQANRAYDFNGVNTKIVTTLTSNADFLNGFTISVWVKLRNFGGGISDERLFDKSSDADANNGFYARILSSGRVGININDGVLITSASGDMALNQWQHILTTVANVGGEGYVTHYINGVLSGTPQVSNTLSEITTANPLTIGNRSMSIDRPVNGGISDVRIYNRVLSASERASLYEQYNPGLEVNTLNVTENTQAIRLVNLNVTSALAAGSSTIMTFAHDNSDLLTLYAESNGSGGVQNQRVGIGTTTPTAFLHAQANTTATALAVRQDSTGDILNLFDGASEIMSVIDGGLVGIGTTTPASRLSVSTLAQAAPTTKLFTVASTTGASLFQVNANGRVGIGVASPSAKLHVVSTTEQARLAYNSSNYLSVTVSSAGNATLAVTGTTPKYTISVGGSTVWSASSTAITANVPVNMGNIVTAQDLGRHTLYNQPVSSALAIGTAVGPSFSIDNNAILTVYAESNGSGGIQNSRVGVGTSTPKSVLSVSTLSSAAASTKLFTIASTTGQALFQILAGGQIMAPRSGLCVDSDGTCVATIGTINAPTITTAASDVAEKYPSVEELEAGDLVMADINNEGYVVKTTGEYDNNVIGVVSQQPGIILGVEVEGYPIALVGRIPTKVTGLNGVIRPGDSLTVAPVAGYAMKLNEGDTSKVIGTALESFDGVGEVTGLISMFINPDYRSAFASADFGNITDGQIATNAAISDLKLGTIRTAGKIALTALPVEIALLQGDTQTFRGNYIFGADANTADLVVFNAKFGSDIKFAIDGLYNIGSEEAAAANVYTKQLNSSKIVVAADLSAMQDYNIDDYGLYLAASSGNAFFGDNIIVGAIHELPVQLPIYPNFVMDGGDLFVNDDLGVGGDLYVVGGIRVSGAIEFAKEGIAQMMSIDEIIANGTPRSARGGDVVVVNASGTSQAIISNQANSFAILGVVGTSSGAVFGANANDGDCENAVETRNCASLPVVVSGVAVVKVSAENGPIHKGDKLTTSETAGYAMLATRPGAGLLGMALEELAEGQSQIRVLVDLGTYYAPVAKVITVASSGADYRTITRALDSISDNSAQNRYIIKVGPGLYEEQFEMKDYVDVVGEGNNLVTIQSDESPVVIASSVSRLEGVTVKSVSVDDEPVLVSISAGSPVLQNLNFEAASANQAVGINITGEPVQVSLNKLDFDSNYSQAIVNLASTTVSIMHSDLSAINGTAMVAGNGVIKSYFNNYDGIFGDIAVAAGVRFESVSDQYAQVSNAGIFLDKTNQGKVDSDYIDYGWLVEETTGQALNIKVSAGEGYINGVKVNTAEVNDIAVSASSTTYLLMTDQGEVTATSTALISQPSILIATVQTDLNAITNIINERSNEITVAKQGGQYRTISGALDSIVSASENNHWTIKVEPGIYNEQVELKPYVDIIGAGRDNTTIMAINKPAIISDVRAQNFAPLPAGATSTPAIGDSKISNVKLSLAGDTRGQAVVDLADLNLTLEDVNIAWSGNEGVNGTAVAINGAGNVTVNRLNALGVAYGLTSNVINDGSATSTVAISYSNISTTVADIRTVCIDAATGQECDDNTVRAQNFAPLPAHIISSYNTLAGSGTNFDIAEGTIISSAHDTYLKYQGEGEFRQNDYFRNNSNTAASLFNIQNAGFNLFNVTASGTIAINPQNTTGDSVMITSATASSTLTVINSGAGTALRVVGNMILTSATSGIPVVLSSAGAELNVGAPGDTINLNVDGVVYNFKENVRRDTMSAYLSAPVSGDKVWGDGNNSWSPAENITILGAKMQYACAEEGTLQLVLKDKTGNTIANLNGFSCGGFYKVEENDLEYHLTPDDGMYVDVVSSTEGVTNVTITIEFVYDNR
ncbi:MAG: LamG-like jellyroll fold domain-containing protein [Candidatus Komeilibacteria bacterium]|nr:LamG-like jellyroll fold domain-containing protein [Candidatus Komeilibacteria bacterium]